MMLESLNGWAVRVHVCVLLHTYGRQEFGLNQFSRAILTKKDLLG